jgi:tetratricopeptide (TPR) repeat protein
MDKDTSEITKLTERISKDPKSKLFVPLAEEYKKGGDIEMAVHVLTEGLKNNPSYVTARSFLGKLLLDQGDLPAAQKEFEEVVKAIPDNLMAQRKLGDIYALQNNPAEALQHYKRVLALNPKDNETALLVAEAEAGRDIRKLVPAPKLTTPAQPEPSAPQQPAKPAAAPVQHAVKPQVIPSTKAAVAPPSGAAEEAEEVLFVEPLDPADVAAQTIIGQPASEAFDFLAENEAAAPADESGHRTDFFALSEAPAAAEELLFPTEVPTENAAETDPFGLAETTAPVEGSTLSPGAMDPFALAGETAPFLDPIGVPPDMEEPFADLHASAGEEDLLLDTGDPFVAAEEIPSLGLDEPFGSERSLSADEEPIEAFIVDEPLDAAQEEAFIPDETTFAADVPDRSAAFQMPDTGDDPDVITAEIVEESEKQADDFTTDTLAELYISQGFFEKAIDIYERMLADHPTSEGLKDKLTHVRGLAAAASESDAVEPDDTPVTVPGADVFAAPAQGLTQPRLDDWELPASKVSAPTDDSASRTVSQPKPFDLGFEPREYVPPDALPRKREPSGGTEGDTPEGPASQQAPARTAAAAPTGPVDRKETVERLESWLKNIMKES